MIRQALLYFVILHTSCSPAHLSHCMTYQHLNRQSFLKGPTSQGNLQKNHIDLLCVMCSALTWSTLSRAKKTLVTIPCCCDYQWHHNLTRQLHKITLWHTLGIGILGHFPGNGFSWKWRQQLIKKSAQRKMHTHNPVRQCNDDHYDGGMMCVCPLLTKKNLPRFLHSPKNKYMCILISPLKILHHWNTWNTLPKQKR